MPTVSQPGVSQNCCFAVGRALRYTCDNMNSITPRKQHLSHVLRCVTVGRSALRGIALALLLALTVPWTLQAEDTANTGNLEELRAAYFALAAEQRAEPAPDPEQVAELLETLRHSIPGSDADESQERTRFDSSTALREAARIALPQINAAGGAQPTRLSDDAVKALNVLIDPTAARRVFSSSGPDAAPKIDPLLELSFERLAVLYEQQSRLQRRVFAHYINVSLDRYRAVAALTKVYAARSSPHTSARSATDGATESPTDSIDDLDISASPEQLSPVEVAVRVLGSPELRREVAVASPASPVSQTVTTGLEELYKRVDLVVAESNLPEAGYSSPRVEVLRPTLGVGRLSESVIPYRRNVALSGVASGENERRQILPYEAAAELYYRVFYEVSHEFRSGSLLPEGEYSYELWGRLHGQYIVNVPRPDTASQSLEDRFVAGLEPEFRLRAAVDDTQFAAAVARELNDSILRSASRYIERPLSLLDMQPELYLGAAYRQLGPARSPQENFVAVRRLLLELEQDVLSERGYLRTRAQLMRSSKRTAGDAAGAIQ